MSRQERAKQFMPFAALKGYEDALRKKEKVTVPKAQLCPERQEELDRILADLEGCSYVVDEVKKGERIKKAPIPFTTSTMQQEASKALNFSTQKTMRLAQQLYEGVEVKGHGTIGLITYLRTDSTRIAEEADATARAFIKEQYGEKYVIKNEQSKKNGGKIQDAHEAIRPTDIALTPLW